MGASPKYKIFTHTGEYIASCKHATDAAFLASSYGAGATVRIAHSKKAIVFTEGEHVFRCEIITGGGIRFHAPEDMPPELVETLERNAIDDAGRLWAGLSPDAVSDYIWAQEERLWLGRPSWNRTNPVRGVCS